MHARAMHELAERHDGGILVRLLWDPGEDRVLVDYRDPTRRNP